MFKNRARKPIVKMKTYLKYGFVITEHEFYYCPRCGSLLNAGSGYQPKHCGGCGQKISFAGIVWKDDKKLGYLENELNI